MKKRKHLIFGLVIGFIIGFAVAKIDWGFIGGNIVTCDYGANPDTNGCCPGEIYTDMGDQGFNCCPENGDNCFPPIR